MGLFIIWFCLLDNVFTDARKHCLSIQIGFLGFFKSPASTLPSFIGETVQFSSPFDDNVLNGAGSQSTLRVSNRNKVHSPATRLSLCASSYAHNKPIVAPYRCGNEEAGSLYEDTNRCVNSIVYQQTFVFTKALCRQKERYLSALQPRISVKPA